MQKLTLKITRDYLSFLGLRLRRNAEFDEYVLVIPSDNPNDPDTYFTNGLDDIIETARAMKGGHPNIQDAEDCLQSQGIIVQTKDPTCALCDAGEEHEH